jgi:hypothetical protein
VLTEVSTVAGPEAISALDWVSALRRSVVVPSLIEAVEAPSMEPGWRRGSLARIEAQLR